MIVRTQTQHPQTQGLIRIRCPCGKVCMEANFTGMLVFRCRKCRQWIIVEKNEKKSENQEKA